MSLLALFESLTLLHGNNMNGIVPKSRTFVHLLLRGFRIRDLRTDIYLRLL